MTIRKIRSKALPVAAIAATLAVLGGGIASAQDGGSAASSGSEGSSGSSSGSESSGGSGNSSSSGSSGSPVSGSLGSLSTSSLGSSGNPASEPLTFDGWGKCPVAGDDIGTCVTVVVRGGEMQIGGLKVPVPDGGLKIAGGVTYVEDGNDWKDVFIPEPGTNFGVTSTPITVPGGALGIDTPLNLTQIQSTVEAVGMPSVDVLDAAVSMPVRLKLENPLLGDKCYLGSESNPITLNLKTTGNPPSEPIGGGTPGAVFRAVPHTDTTFAVPAATGCGPLGSLNWAVNLRASTPSASGHNSLATTSDVYNVAGFEVTPRQ